jgi:hypothetical protein
MTGLKSNETKAKSIVIYKPIYIYIYIYMTIKRDMLYSSSTSLFLVAVMHQVEIKHLNKDRISYYSKHLLCNFFFFRITIAATIFCQYLHVPILGDHFIRHLNYSGNQHFTLIVYYPGKDLTYKFKMK